MIPTKIKKLFLQGIALCFALLVYAISYSQSKIDSLLGKLDPQRFAASIGEKSKKLEDALVKKSLKTLSSMHKQEEKIYMKLLKTKDSLVAKASLEGIEDKYASLKDKLKSPAILSKAKQYIPKLDSLSTSLKFLDANGVGGKVKETLAKATSLQDKFQQAEEIKKFIKSRKDQLKQQLEKLGMVKQLKKINKQVYYYYDVVKNWKQTLSDPKKIEKKALQLLAKTKLFQNFMAKNSMFASLFRMPGDANDPAYIASLAGLQTRSQVNSLIQQQIQSAGPNGMQTFQNNLQSAQSELNQLKNKFLKGGGGSSDDIMPEGFIVNQEKSKSFLKRLDYSATVQSQKGTNFFPTHSDIGLSVGFKASQNKIFSIGLVYKLGLGNGWQHIKFTHEGIGIKSGIDLKLKRSFWFSAGYEMNHWAAFDRIDQLRGLNSWTQSGLAGISKVVNVKSKFFKKTRAQILWDFLSYRQRPYQPPIIFRLNYNFK